MKFNQNQESKKKDILTKSNYGTDKAPILIALKGCLIVLTFFIFSNSQGQKITAEYQLKMLKMDILTLSNTYNDSLTITPSKTEFSHKIFLNDTIDNPINTNEITTIYVEEKTIMLTNIKSTFLFQLKNKFVEENKEGLIEHYYCTKGNNLYLIIIVKDGVYIRKDSSYYSSFFYHKEL
tara:strand:- start:2307 stop:2843 length:537 start_codon:yes stop_codon:yes gene_type:complete